MYDFELKSGQIKVVPYKDSEKIYRKVYRELKTLIDDRWFFCDANVCEKAHKTFIEDCIVVCNHLRVNDDSEHSFHYFYDMLDEWEYRKSHLRKSKNYDVIKKFYDEVTPEAEKIIDRIVDGDDVFVNRDNFVHLKKTYEEVYLNKGE